MAIRTAGLDVKRLSAYVDQHRQANNVPGVEVVVIRDQEVLFAGGFGYRDLERELPVTSRTVFAHGSTGKAFTSCLVGQLVDEGTLAWDTPIREYLPDFRLQDEYAANHLTLRDVLSHRGGLSVNDMVWLAWPELPRAELVRRLRFLEPYTEIRKAWMYANFGYFLAGHVAEVVTHSTFEEQLRQRIFEPLGMSNTYCNTDQVQRLDDHAKPYGGKAGQTVPLNYRNTNHTVPAGGIMSCAEDTARWLLLHINGGELEGKRLISESALAETRTVQIPLPGAPGGWTDSTSHVYGYGMGWIVSTYRGRRHLGHSGGIDGFSSQLELLPDERIGVAVSTNRAAGLANPLCRYILDELLGVEERDWAAEAKKQADELIARMREVTGSAAIAVPSTRPSHPLLEYAGTYEHPAYGPLEVAVDGDRLNARLGVLGFEGSHRHYDTWDILCDEVSETPFTLNFVADVSGAIAEARTNFAPLSKHLVFARVAGDGPGR